MIFIELRCEDSAEPYSAGGYVEKDGHHVIERCWSHDNNGLGVFSDGSRSGAISGFRELSIDAKANGWKRLKHGWVCPFCVQERLKINKKSV